MSWVLSANLSSRLVGSSRRRNAEERRTHTSSLVRIYVWILQRGFPQSVQDAVVATEERAREAAAAASAPAAGAVVPLEAALEEAAALKAAEEKKRSAELKAASGESKAKAR
jgi:hypothetical protein